MEIEDGEPCVVSVQGYWPGKADHGGRGAVFEVLSGDVVVFSDSSDRRPTDGWKPMNMSFYPGRHRITFRLRSDLGSPPGHLFAVRIRRQE